MGGEVNDSFELLTFYRKSLHLQWGESGRIFTAAGRLALRSPHGLRSSWVPGDIIYLGLDFHCPYGGIELGPPTMQANTAARVLYMTY